MAEPNVHAIHSLLLDVFIKSVFLAQEHNRRSINKFYFIKASLSIDVLLLLTSEAKILDKKHQKVGQRRYA